MIRRAWTKLVNTLLPNESLEESRAKWNRLGSDNARFYVLTDQGKEISEVEFKKAGKRDYQTYVKSDGLLLEKLTPLSEKRVLEIGCGAGRITEFIAEDFQEVQGIDISRTMIEEGKRRLPHVRNISLRETDGISYPFADSTFDFVFSFIVFQHMPHEVIERNLQEIARVLKPGGVAKIQFRGIPVKKTDWFYGPSFSKESILKMVRSLPLRIFSTEGEGEKYFFILFEKV